MLTKGGNEESGKLNDIPAAAWTNMCQFVEQTQILYTLHAWKLGDPSLASIPRLSRNI